MLQHLVEQMSVIGGIGGVQRILGLAVTLVAVSMSVNLGDKVLVEVRWVLVHIHIYT